MRAMNDQDVNQQVDQRCNHGLSPIFRCFDPAANRLAILRQRSKASHREDGQEIGRIRFAKERAPGKWLWNVTVTIPGPPFGDAKSIDEAKDRFKAAWLAFKEKHGPEQLARAYEEMNHANRPGRFQR